jgi:hypothetical protein
MAEYEPTSRRPIAQIFRRTAEAATRCKQLRDVLEPTLTPASHGSVRVTHLDSGILVIIALWAIELRRRRLQTTTAT